MAIDFGFSDFLDLADTVLSIGSSAAQIKIAGDTARLQKKELARRTAIEKARVKRETRIRQAQLLASQGLSGAKLSTAASGVIGLETSAAAGLLDLEAQTLAQSKQFSLQQSAAVTQGAVDVFTSLGTFAATDIGKSVGDFTAGLLDTPDSPVTGLSTIHEEF